MESGCESEACAGAVQRLFLEFSRSPRLFPLCGQG
jgi:hypothetical protein